MNLSGKLIGNERTAASMCRLAAMLLVTFASIPSYGSTNTGALAVSANVPALCAVTGTSIAFGNYSGAQLDQSGSIGVVCTYATTYTIALDVGSGSGATVSSRVMTGPASSTLKYSIYRDSARTNVWGQTTGTDTLAGTGSGLLQNISVYGRIPANQTPLAGSYADTIIVTLTY